MLRTVIVITVTFALASGAFAQTTFQPIALPGDPVLGTSYEMYTLTNVAQVSQVGRVFFVANTRQGGNGRYGIFYKDAAGIHPLMVEEMPAPGGLPGNIAVVAWSFFMSPNGEFVTGSATLTGPGITPANDSYAWRWSQQGIEVVAREGDQIGALTIVQVSPYLPASDSGSTAVRVVLRPSSGQDRVGLLYHTPVTGSVLVALSGDVLFSNPDCWTISPTPSAVVGMQSDGSAVFSHDVPLCGSPATGRFGWTWFDGASHAPLAREGSLVIFSPFHGTYGRLSSIAALLGADRVVAFSGDNSTWSVGIGGAWRTLYDPGVPGPNVPAQSYLRADSPAAISGNEHFSSLGRLLGPNIPGNSVAVAFLASGGQASLIAYQGQPIPGMPGQPTGFESTGIVSINGINLAGDIVAYLQGTFNGAFVSGVGYGGVGTFAAVLRTGDTLPFNDGEPGIVDYANPPTPVGQSAVSNGVDGWGMIINDAGQFPVYAVLNNNTGAHPRQGLYLVTPSEMMPCIADFNGDESVTSQDFFDFLMAFFGQLPLADVNLDGQTNSQDFFDFLAAFFAGC